jgi:predicted homoserine dehydrogenase-like protein
VIPPVVQTSPAPAPNRPGSAVVSVDDVELDRDLDVVDLRREMERAAAPPTIKAA